MLQTQGKDTKHIFKTEGIYHPEGVAKTEGIVHPDKLGRLPEKPFKK